MFHPTVPLFLPYLSFDPLFLFFLLFLYSAVSLFQLFLLFLCSNVFVPTVLLFLFLFFSLLLLFHTSYFSSVPTVPLFCFYSFCSNISLFLLFHSSYFSSISYCSALSVCTLSALMSLCSYCATVPTFRLSLFCSTYVSLSLF